MKGTGRSFSFPAMQGLLMFGEMSGLGERLVAPVTDIGPFPCMGALVDDEVTGLGERVVTPVTDIGLFPCVGTLVISEIVG
ncbi:hypothetical protein [Sansalvadorimonas verongulae]|uniref:hypothetical protein n=1 Tax=Sansalvadorimonas verongulae TaxID=2172824 RepID=UPI0012BD48E0|nr:hypothetical protein [Sansalvadorimonas verongulae]MTI12503.1 hypothetical protein [Sansalvadorimonas verongulae]